MPGPVLVTGATGFAGGHLLDALAHERVVAWYRAGAPPAPAAAGVVWEMVDVLDRSAVREALARIGPAAVYHCAGAAHVGRSWESIEPTFAVNVRGTHHLVEGLRDNRLDASVLIPSSSMVYAAAIVPHAEDHPLLPASPYALSKLAQELVGGGNPGGPNVFIARAFNHLGPRQDPQFAASGFARRIAEIEAGHGAPEIAVGNLAARRDWTDVRDTVRAYRLIVERGLPAVPVMNQDDMVGVITPTDICRAMVAVA